MKNESVELELNSNQSYDEIQGVLLGPLEMPG